MQFSNKKQAGVTLLEIMLVLAVAAMVIVMSIRYYQSAQTSQQANTAVSLIQSITAAADNLAIGTGTYSEVTNTAISTLTGPLFSPSGGPVVISAPLATRYTVSIPLSVDSCALVLSRVSAVPKISTPACAAGTGVFSYTYDATK